MTTRNALPQDALPMQEAVTRFHVTRRTLDRWASAGKLKTYRSGVYGDTRVYVRASVVLRLQRASTEHGMGRPGGWRRQVPELSPTSHEEEELTV